MKMDDRGVITSCSRCGRKNRIPFAKLGQRGECGGCGETLRPPPEPVEAGSTQAFNRLATESPIPVLVDYWAPWCGPCKMVAPELAKLAAANAGRFVVVKVNTEELQEVAARAQIQAIPTMALLLGGEEIARVSGARPAKDIEAFVRQTLAKTGFRPSGGSTIG